MGLGFPINKPKDIGESIKRAFRMGKTPLLLDRTEDRKANIDVLFENGDCSEIWPSGAVVLKGKKMDSDQFRGKVSMLSDFFWGESGGGANLGFGTWL